MALVPLQNEHLKLILPWRNSLAVRRAMYNHHIISIEEHLSWFEELKKDDTKQWFLFIDEKDEPQGVVYFTEINYEHQTAFWGFYARPEVIAGTGLKMELDALDFAFEELKVAKLSCEVLANNPAVINMHIKVGFSEEGRFREQHLIGNQRLDIVRLGLTASEWLTSRNKIAKRVSQLIEIQNKLPPPAKKLEIVILTDNTSWINKHLLDLRMDWEAQGHRVLWAHTTDDVPKPFKRRLQQPDDTLTLRFCFCLGFSEIVNQQFRMHFHHTLIVHESDLPCGKGWSPLSWQILEGKNTIPVTLIEADERVDSGVIYAQDLISFEGHELLDELRAAQSEATHQLCRWFVDTYPQSLDQAKIQSGKESFYSRRQPKDSQLNPDRSLRDQFDLLRIVDNEHYPAFFELRNHRYRVSIEAMDNE